MPEPLWNRLEASWLHLFDTSLYGRAWVHDLDLDDLMFENLGSDVTQPLPHGHFEAVGTSLRLDQIRRVTILRGRSRR